MRLNRVYVVVWAGFGDTLMMRRGVFLTRKRAEKCAADYRTRVAPDARVTTRPVI